MRMMRSGLVVAAMCAVVYLPSVKAQANFVEASAEGPQVKDDLFAGTEKFAQGATETTDVNLDKDMLTMVGKGKGKGEGKGNGAGLADKMDFVIVHSYTYDKPGMYRMEDVEAFRRKLKDGSWNCFVHVKEKDEATDVCMRKSGDDTSEMVVMTAEPKELTFVHIKGRGISMNDLGKFGYDGGYGGGYGGGHHRAPEPPTPPTPPRPGSAPTAPAPPPAPAAPSV
jgi:hypothetical protein